MTEEQRQKRHIAKAHPAKTFFVNMLTRDIDLSDAILDLLDNCVDGIVRKKWKNGIPEDVIKPYEGYKASIRFNEEKFIIEDNCEGIPLHIAENHAFMMGRNKPEGEKDIPTVGMYGIGMKRAMFKMGKHSVVTSHTEKESFEVIIDKEWIEDDDNWDIPIQEIEPVDTQGTRIIVEDLREEIAEVYKQEIFESEFIKTVERHYSFIISKGFKVEVNGKLVTPRPIELWFDRESGIEPYLYEAKIKDVDISLQVGFCRKMPSEEELEQEQVIKNTRDDSGWTIICNDRVVVYRDKTLLTGWGEADVPSFHNQFNGISGTVIFRSNKPEQLPLTTTKRGVEGNSPIYLQVKNHMRRGTKLYTNYTNLWKKNIDAERKMTQKVNSIEVTKIKDYIPQEKWKENKKEGIVIERVYKPELPKPQRKVKDVQISFSREKAQVSKLGEYLFGDPFASAAQVGMECFDRILKEMEE